MKFTRFEDIESGKRQENLSKKFMLSTKTIRTNYGFKDQKQLHASLDYFPPVESRSERISRSLLRC